MTSGTLIPLCEPSALCIVTLTLLENPSALGDPQHSEGHNVHISVL